MMKFSCMVTFGDWTHAMGTYGEPGICYILKRIACTGFKRVYWRSSDGSGQAFYPSRVTNASFRYEAYDPAKYPEHFMGPAFKNSEPWWDIWWILREQSETQSIMDFSQLDTIGIARHYAGKFGLEFYLWHEHAEDHGSIGQIGRMGLRHPEWFTLNRDGKASHCRFSWAIEPAVEYRLAWIRELMEYEPDGIFIDLVKSVEGTAGVGAVPHFDEKGVWYCTYDKPAVDMFKNTAGRDPFMIPNDDEEWVHFRASYVTDFFRKIRKMQKDSYPGIRLGMFGCPVGRMGLATDDRLIPLSDPLRAYLEDHEAITGEGLVDEFVNCYADGSETADNMKIQKMVCDSRSLVKPPCKYNGTQIQVYGFADRKELEGAARSAADAGCEELVFFESTPLQTNNTWGIVHDVIETLTKDNRQ